MLTQLYKEVNFMTPEQVKEDILKYCIKQQDFNSFQVAQAFKLYNPKPDITIVNYVCDTSGLFDRIGIESGITGCQHFKLKESSCK